MTSKQIWSGVLIVALSVLPIMPAQADTLKTDENHIVIGIVAVVAAIAVVTIVLIYHSKKHEITGCVSSGQNGMVLTDEKDGQVYTLSGYKTGVKPGERMRLHGKKLKPISADQTLIWQATDDKDFGTCRP
jgi:hypothetical protein